MKKKLYGNYLGIVISGADKDPEYRGRCQIFFPGVSNTLYKKINKNIKDLSFGHIDPSVLTPDIIQDLRIVLPWSECAAPIAGGGTSAYYNGVTKSTGLGFAKTIDANSPTTHENPQPYAKSDVNGRPDDIEVPKKFQSIQETKGTSFFNTKKANLTVNVDSAAIKNLGYSQTRITDTSPILSNDGKFIGKIGSEYIGMVAPLKGSGSPLETLSNGELLNVTFTKNGKSYTINNVAVQDRGPRNNPSQNKYEFSYGTYQHLNSLGAGFGLPSEKNRGGLIGSAGWDISYEKTGKKLNSPEDIENYKNSPQNLQLASLSNVPPIDTTQTAVNPDPTNDSVPTTPALAGYSDRPNGVFSFPRMGAKVWAFFYGGDVQRPVYFAAAYEPDSIRYAIGSSSDSKRIVEPDDLPTNAGEGLGGSSLFSGESEVSESIQTESTRTCAGVTESIFSGSGAKNGIPILDSSFNFYNLDSSGVYTKKNDATIRSGDNSSYFRTTDSGIDINTTSGDITFTGDVNINGNFKVNSGTNQVNSKETQKHIDAEQNAVSAIANQTAKDVTQGGEEQGCPNCEQKLADDRSDFVTRILRTIRKFSNILPWDCWNWGVTKFLINFIAIPMLNEISVLAVSGGKGCGMCKSGKVKSYSKAIENANKKASETFTQKQNELNQSAKHFKAGSNVQTVLGSWGIDAGGGNMNTAKCSQELPDDCSLIITGVKGGEGGSSIRMHPYSEPVNTVVYLPPNKTTVGDIYLRSANDIKMIAGSPGISMETNGKISITGGFLDLNSTDGPAVLTSKNVTNVNGEKVHITGAKGIGLTAPSVGVNGNLGVTGNLGVMGSVTIDGALSVKHLNVKTMRSETTSNSSPKSTSNATTYYTGGAAGINIFDKIKNVLVRDNPLKMLLLTPKGLLTLFQEVYDRILLMIGIHPVPTGYFVGYGSGVVFNFTSNSSKVPEDHSHQFTNVQMRQLGDSKAWVQAADDPSSPAPNPAPAQGDDPPGGPHSLAGCGGGGFGFSTGSNASRRRNARNSRYGVPINNLNYGKITPQGYFNGVNIITNNTILSGISGGFITTTTDLSGNIITINNSITANGLDIIYDFNDNSQKWDYDENGDIRPRDLVRFSISEDCL